MKSLTPEQWLVIEEAAQVFESAAKYNYSMGRTVFAYSQQDRANKLREIIDENKI